MKLWLAYGVFGLCAAMILLIALVGCTTEPDGPHVDITGNTAPVLVNITNGSGSPVGTAPCSTSSQQGNGINGTVPTQDCSTQANGNSAGATGPEAVIP
jgi:hypothetical protein